MERQTWERERHVLSVCVGFDVVRKEMRGGHRMEDKENEDNDESEKQFQRYQLFQKIEGERGYREKKFKMLQLWFHFKTVLVRNCARA